MQPDRQSGILDCKTDCLNGKTNCPHSQRNRLGDLLAGVDNKVNSVESRTCSDNYTANLRIQTDAFE